MGRQIAVVLNDADEEEFLAFVRGGAPVELLESFAPTREGLWVPDFAGEREGHWSYSLWNRRFPWQPEYRQVGPDARHPSMRGWWYVGNTAAAPVLEFTRSPLDGTRPGRLYWAKDFAAPSPLSYDVESFSRWIDEIWAWVRRTGRRLPVSSGVSAYHLRGARAGRE